MLKSIYFIFRLKSMFRAGSGVFFPFILGHFDIYFFGAWPIRSCFCLLALLRTFPAGCPWYYCIHGILHRAAQWSSHSGRWGLWVLVISLRVRASSSFKLSLPEIFWSSWPLACWAGLSMVGLKMTLYWKWPHIEDELILKMAIDDRWKTTLDETKFDIYMPGFAGSCCLYL